MALIERRRAESAAAARGAARARALRARRSNRVRCFTRAGVAAALGNALADATGIRFTAVPFKPDRIFPALKEKFGS